MYAFFQFVVVFLCSSAITFMVSYIFGNLQKYPNIMIPMNFIISVVLGGLSIFFT